MKRLYPMMAILFAVTLTLCSCAWYEPEVSICEQEEYAIGSLICKKCAEYGTTPEALNGVLLDGAAIDVIIQPANRDDICGFLQGLASFYNQDNVIWYDLIEFTKLNAEQNMAIAAIIQRRIPLDEFSTVRFISPEDDYLLRQGWQRHWDQLRCEDL